MSWQTEAERLKFDEGMSWTKIADELKHYFPGKNNQQVLETVRGYLRKCDRYSDKKEGQDLNKTAIALLTKGTTIDNMSKRLGMSNNICQAVLEEIRNQGYNVLQIGDELKISNIVIPQTNIIPSKWAGESIIRFGLMGDTQINSKYTQITHLHKLYDIYEEEGITDVYHDGDIDEGEEMRPGHKYECYTQGADDHVTEITKVYPKRKGVKTRFITGNHDHSIIKRAGYDIGPAIAQKRDDFEYLGQSSALINLTDSCTLELRHPGDGTAYALSYKIQKMIEAMSGGEKPNIMAIGHYHKADYMFYRNVHAIQTGCFQAQTPWMRGKGIPAHMGGWIVEVHVNDDGTISRFKQEFIPFYRAIKDDYLNWR